MAMPKWLAACEEGKLPLPPQYEASNLTWLEKNSSAQGLGRAKNGLKILLLMESVAATVNNQHAIQPHAFLPKLATTKSNIKKYNGTQNFGSLKNSVTLSRYSFWQSLFIFKNINLSNQTNFSLI